MTWSEQQKIEFAAPEYLCNVIRIVTETGFRIYKELTPVKKDRLDLVNRTVWIRSEVISRAFRRASACASHRSGAAAGSTNRDSQGRNLPADSRRYQTVRH